MVVVWSGGGVQQHLGPPMAPAAVGWRWALQRCLYFAADKLLAMQPLLAFLKPGDRNVFERVEMEMDIQRFVVILERRWAHEMCAGQKRRGEPEGNGLGLTSLRRNQGDGPSQVSHVRSSVRIIYSYEREKKKPGRKRTGTIMYDIGN